MVRPAGSSVSLPRWEEGIQPESDDSREEQLKGCEAVRRGREAILEGVSLPQAEALQPHKAIYLSLVKI